MLTPFLQKLISWAFLLVSKLLRTLHHLHSQPLSQSYHLSPVQSAISVSDLHWISCCLSLLPSDEHPSQHLLHPEHQPLHCSFSWAGRASWAQLCPSCQSEQHLPCHLRLSLACHASWAQLRLCCWDQQQHPRRSRLCGACRASLAWPRLCWRTQVQAFSWPRLRQRHCSQRAWLPCLSWLFSWQPWLPAAELPPLG